MVGVQAAPASATPPATSNAEAIVLVLLLFWNRFAFATVVAAIAVEYSWFSGFLGIFFLSRSVLSNNVGCHATPAIATPPATFKADFTLYPSFLRC